MWYWIILVFFSDKDYENYLEINKKNLKKEEFHINLQSKKPLILGYIST